MTQNVITALAALGIVGQLAVVLLVLAGLLRLVGVPGPLASIRDVIWGYELWLVFLVSALATGGSLFLSEIANFVPCELCWFQRIFMYPLAVTTLLAALYNDHRVARYLLPLPAIGAGVSIYHVLVENGVFEQTKACLVSAPGGCATKWIDRFGYMTIPTLALTAFVLTFALLLFALLEPSGDAGTSTDERDRAATLNAND